MAYNGSGTFALFSPGNPVVTGTTISSDWANNTLNDIATGLSTAITKDGQTTVTTNISLSSHKLTNVTAGTATTDAATVGQIQSSAVQLLGTVAGTNTITAVLTPALTAYAAGQRYTFTPAATNTAATTININSVGAKSIFWNGAACVGGELLINVPVSIYYDGTQFHIGGNGFNAPFSDAHVIVEGSADATKKVRFEVDGLTTATTRVATWPDKSGTVAMTSDIGALRSYLTGLTMSTAGASTTMSIAAGAATDSTTTALMTLAAAINKTTSAWAVGSGNGGLDTGAIANSTWYHFFEIQRVDTGVVDVIFSTSVAGPTMPSNYTIYRRIGSGKTNGSAQWTRFFQLGDLFTWDIPVNDVAAATNPGTSAVSRTLTVPTQVVVMAWFTNYETNQSNNRFVLWTALDQTDSTPSAALNSLNVNISAGNLAANGEFYVKTNSSAQVRYRTNASGASDTTNVVTKGWIDSRGRND